MRKMLLVVCFSLMASLYGLELDGSHVKGPLSETLIACGGGSAWLLEPDGKVSWKKDGCGNIHRALKRGDKVYWSNSSIYVTDLKTGKTELFYRPAPSEGTYGFDLTPEGTMVVAENATDYITELKLDTKEPLVHFKGDSRDANGKTSDPHHHYRMISKTSAGTYLVCCSGANIVTQFKTEREQERLAQLQEVSALAQVEADKKNGNYILDLGFLLVDGKYQ